MLGVTVAGEEDSNFTKVHDNGYIRAAKRLYMTATPKIFSASNIRKAKENNALLWSMDDKNIYGPEFFRLSFSHAVKLGLLSDYKVMILAIYDNYVSNTVSALQNGEVKLDDAAKIVGCWKGLSKHLTSVDKDTISSDPTPMRSTVAFSSCLLHTGAIFQGQSF